MRMNETEKELITMVLSGRTEAFEPLVTPYRGPLLALATRLTRNREEALEVAQEALLRAFRSLGRFDRLPLVPELAFPDRGQRGPGPL